MTSQLPIRHHLPTTAHLPQLLSNAYIRPQSSYLTPERQPALPHLLTRCQLSRAVHLPSQSTFAPHNKRLSKKSSRSSIAQRSPSPHAQLKPYWRFTPAQQSNKRSMKLSPVDWSQHSLNERRNGKPSKLICAGTTAQPRYASNDTKHKEKPLTVSNETTVTTPLSSSPTLKDYYVPPIGLNSLTTAKSPCWIKTATILTPTSLTSTQPPSTTPTIPLSPCPYGSDIFSQDQPLCSINSTIRQPISMTGEYWPTSYASASMTTTSHVPKHASNNTRQSTTVSSSAVALFKADWRQRKSTCSLDIWRLSTPDIPVLAHMVHGGSELRQILTSREDSRTNGGSDVTGTRYS